MHSQSEFGKNGSWMRSKGEMMRIALWLCQRKLKI